MRFALNISLNTKISIICSLAIIVSQFIFSTISIQKSSAKMFADFKQNSERIVSESSESLVNLLWNYDFVTAKNIVKTKLEVPIFLGAMVTDVATNKVVMGIAKGNDSIVDIEKSLSKSKNVITIVDSINHDGKVTWVGEYYFSDEQIHAENRSNIMFSIVSSLLLVIILAIVIIVLLNVLIFKRLKMAAVMMEDIAKGEGDLTKSMKVSNRDEIGVLSDNFNRFIGKIRGIIIDVAQTNHDLSEASSALATSSTRIASSASNISDQTSEVSMASTTSSSRINDISDKTNHISEKVCSIASAIEEMSASLNEVSKNCIDQARIVNNADSDTAKTTEMIVQLQGNAAEIAKISIVISNIADQTNMLALNASVEAANAGHAGRGFAVVANEVKELAKKTAGATREIDVKIESMQSIVDNTSNFIQSIVSVIHKINEISMNIASAVEEQSATVHEISSNVSSTTASTIEVRDNTEAIVGNLENISTRISGIDHDMAGTVQSVNDINTSAEMLTELSEKLDRLVSQFKY